MHSSHNKFVCVGPGQGVLVDLRTVRGFYPRAPTKGAALGERPGNRVSWTSDSLRLCLDNSSYNALLPYPTVTGNHSKQYRSKSRRTATAELTLCMSKHEITDVYPQPALCFPHPGDASAKATSFRRTIPCSSVVRCFIPIYIAPRTQLFAFSRSFPNPEMGRSGPGPRRERRSERCPAPAAMPAFLRMQFLKNARGSSGCCWSVRFIARTASSGSDARLTTSLTSFRVIAPSTRERFRQTASSSGRSSDGGNILTPSGPRSTFGAGT